VDRIGNHDKHSATYQPLKARITSNIALTAAGQGIEKGIAFVVIAVLIRYLDKSLMGEYFFAISVLSLVVLLTEAGTSRHLVRSVAADTTKAAELLGQVLRFRLMLIAVALVLTNICAALISPDLLEIFFWLSIYIFANDLYFAFGATLLGLDAVLKRVLTGLIGPAVLLVLIPLGTTLNWSLRSLLVAHALAGVTMVSITWAITVRTTGWPFRRTSIAEVLQLVARSMPLFILSLLILLHSRLDELMLAAITEYSVVATYAAGYKLLEVSRFAVRPAITVLLPVFTVMAVTADWIPYLRNIRRLIWTAFGIGMLALLLVVPTAHYIVPLVFGENYLSTIDVTRILFLGAPALFVSQAAILLAAALFIDRTAIILAFLAVCTNAGLNALVIPRWGAIGAAWTTVFTESVLALILTAMVFIYVRQKAAAKSQQETVTSPAEPMDTRE
jgi:O-antigen/teichoic acid export membrane protein